jgi:hypothetical protein
MALGWAETREKCARLIIYRPLNSTGDPIYHPTLVGTQFLEKIGLVKSIK